MFPRSKPLVQVLVISHRAHVHCAERAFVGVAVVISTSVSGSSLGSRCRDALRASDRRRRPAPAPASSRPLRDLSKLLGFSERLELLQRLIFDLADPLAG